MRELTLLEEQLISGGAEDSGGVADLPIISNVGGLVVGLLYGFPMGLAVGAQVGGRVSGPIIGFAGGAFGMVFGVIGCMVALGTYGTINGFTAMADYGSRVLTEKIEEYMGWDKTNNNGLQ